jgi:hypothetical protein
MQSMSLTDTTFKIVEKKARDTYLSQKNKNLDQLVKLSLQAVSGTNYKMLFTIAES